MGRTNASRGDTHTDMVLLWVGFIYIIGSRDSQPSIRQEIMASFYCAEALSDLKAHEAFLKCVTFCFSSSTAMAALPSAGTAWLHGSHCKATAINLLPKTWRKCIWPCFKKHINSQGLRWFFSHFVCAHARLYFSWYKQAELLVSAGHIPQWWLYLHLCPTHTLHLRHCRFAACGSSSTPRVSGFSFQLVSTHQHSSEQTGSFWYAIGAVQENLSTLQYDWNQNDWLNPI